MRTPCKNAAKCMGKLLYNVHAKYSVFRFGTTAKIISTHKIKDGDELGISYDNKMLGIRTNTIWYEQFVSPVILTTG